MSETNSFNCPNCGSPLMASGMEKEVKCMYCGSSVIVPEELRDQAPQVQGSADPKQHLQWLMQNGADGTARVVSAEDLGATENSHRAIDLDLWVTPATGAPFDSEKPFDFPPTAIARVGDYVKVKYNPADSFDFAVQINGNWFI
jgi:DNA-directed RNA polymerase subunit RPC12/RpoP